MSALAADTHNALIDRHWSRLLTGTVTALAWSDDGAALLAGCNDGSLHRIGVDGSLLNNWQGHAAGMTLLQSQPGCDQHLASAGDDGRVVLWDSHSGGEQTLLAEQGGRVEHLAWTRDGQMLAAAASKSISLWRGEQSLGIWYDGSRRILAMAWAPDCKRLATATDKGLFLLRTDGSGIDSAELIKLQSLPGVAVMIAWQPNGRALAIGTEDGFLQIWQQCANDDQPQGEQHNPLLTLRSHPEGIAQLAWHPSRPLIATASRSELMLWELSTANEGIRQALRAHAKTITATAWSQDGSLLASADQAGQVCLWNSEGELLCSRHLEDEITAIAWHPQGQALAIGHRSGTLQLLHHQSTDTTQP